MAARFWTGGSGTWNTTNTANWSATTGGAGGASVPTTADTITFDANSGGGTCTVAATGAGTSMTCTGYTGTFSGTQSINLSGVSGATFTAGGSIEAGSNITIVFTNNAASGTRTFNGGTGTTEANSFSLSLQAGQAGCNVAVTIGTPVRDFTVQAGYVGTIANNARTIYGSFTVASASVTFTAGASAVTFAATSAKTITTNGRTFDFPLTFNGVGGTWQLADALVMGTTRAFTLTNGTFDTANFAMTVGSFALGSGTKTLTLGSSTVTCAGAWNANTNVANLTVTASTGIISMTSASAVSFSGGAKTWPTLRIAGAGPITIVQDNAFANITNTVQPCTVRPTAGSVQTFTSFSLTGTVGNLVTLDTSSPGSTATVSKATGTVSVSYMSIKDSIATGGATWNAFTSSGNVDAGNNTGWFFGSGSAGLSRGTGLYVNSSGLYEGTSGLYSGFPGLKN